MTLDQLKQIAIQKRTQLNYKLPDGSIVPAGRNPGSAPTMDLSKGIVGAGNEDLTAGFKEIGDYAVSLGASTVRGGGGGVLDRGTPEGAAIAKKLEGQNVFDDKKALADALKEIAPTNRNQAITEITAGVADVKTRAEALQKKIQEIADYSSSLAPEQRREFEDIFSGRVTTGKYFAKAPDGSVTDLGKGQPLDFTAPAGSNLATNANGTPTFTPEQQETIQTTNTEQNKQLNAILASSGLDDASQAIIRKYFELGASADKKNQEALITILDKAIPSANAIMKQQIRLLQDQLTSDLLDKQKDLEYQTNLKQKQLEDLRVSTKQQKDFYSLEESADLATLERKQAADLEETRQSAAEAGFTFSTRQAEKEKLLGAESGELRESTKRKFGLQQTELGQKLSIAERDVPNEIVRLRQVAAKQQADILRAKESKLGSANLPALLPGQSATGGITGDIEREREKDILSAIQATKSFVF